MPNIPRRLTCAACIILFAISSFAAGNVGTEPAPPPPPSRGISEKVVVALFRAVVRIQCGGDAGTGFLHASGRIITASHVIEGCTKEPTRVIITDPHGIAHGVTHIFWNPVNDLALMTPHTPIDAQPLTLTRKSSVPFGSLIAIAGFPGGYEGRRPLLGVGYLAGDEVRTLEYKDSSGVAATYQSPQWVVNAHLNSGNSGGPMVDAETGEVLGVVVDKIAPIPHWLVEALNRYGLNLQGQQYMAFSADGSPMLGKDGASLVLSERQVLIEALQYLRRQTQLGIGHAVKVGAVIQLLKDAGIAP